MLENAEDRNVRPIREGNITWAPLLLEYIRFGRPDKQKLPLYKTKLLVRGINLSLFLKLTITKAIAMVKEDEAFLEPDQL